MIKHGIMVTKTQRGYWFIINKGRIFLENDTIPCRTFGELPFALDSAKACWLGQHQQLDCYMMTFDDRVENENDWHSVKALLSCGEAIFQLAARASQVALFLQTHRFCGQCGNQMHLVSWELAALCHKCGHRCYPRIAPCVLVAIVQETRILLARSARHKPGFFSILAGFVESAETLEQAAAREVKEEVGIDIQNLRYVGSQPWPFPHSLMTGFIAEYAGGDIVCQPNEIEEAYWCEFDKLPETPGIETLSGQLIALAKAKADK